MINKYSMKIRDIISESWPGTGPIRYVTIDEFISAAKNANHPHYASIQAALFKPNRQIYRGMWSQPNNILAIDIDKTPIRKSTNTSNLYTWWIDNISRKWNDYPKRGKSFICATDQYTAAGFGSEYLMIPYTQTTIGQCHSEDFWNGFESHYTANEFNEVVEDLLSQYVDNVNVSTIEGFISAMAKFDELLPTDEKMKTVFKLKMQDVSNTYKINDTSLYAAMDSYYDPEYNNFSVKHWPTSFLGSDVEVWFSSDCYAIPLTMLHEIKESI